MRILKVAAIEGGSGIVDVAEVMIRMRILKVPTLRDCARRSFRCRSYDPYEDTESFVPFSVVIEKPDVAEVMIRMRILKVEVWRCLDGYLAGCRSYDPYEDTERLMVEELRALPRAGCRSYDPYEDTESLQVSFGVSVQPQLQKL